MSMSDSGNQNEKSSDLQSTFNGVKKESRNSQFCASSAHAKLNDKA